MIGSSKPSTKFSVVCQSLYLANLLLLPGVFFCVLLYFFYRYVTLAESGKAVDKTWQLKTLGIGRIHLYRSVQLSFLAGFMLVILPLLVVLLSEKFEASVMVMLFYFITLHAAFVLIGMLNLSRAMAKKLPLF